MSDLKKKFGKQLKKLREERGLTQAQLAELIGVEPITVSNMEVGRNGAHFKTIEKLMKGLRVKARDLFDF